MLLSDNGIDQALRPSKNLGFQREIMDVLFGSIDVRDLLPTHELEDSSPLSAPDLRLLIDRLQVRSLHIKDKVRQYILSHLRDFSDIFSLCSETASRSVEIYDQVADILFLLSERPLDTEIRDAISEIRSVIREAKEKKELLDLVSLIGNLNKKLNVVREDLKAGRLITAAEAVRDLKVVLRLGVESVVEEREPVVFSLLRKDWNECFDEIQEMLLRLMETAISFEKEGSRLRVRSQLDVDGIEGIELHTILAAMDVVGVLKYGLAKVADLIVRSVITPAINDGCRILWTDNLNDKSGRMTDAILKIVPSSDPKNVDSEGSVIFSEIMQVIKFINRFICLQNGDWMRCFGRLSWPRISDLIISNFLSKVVPSDASKLGEFQTIMKLSSEFESVLKEMMFISASDSEDKRLTNFAENVEVHFAFRKKTEILAKARKFLLRCDFIVSPENISKGLRSKNEGIAEESSDSVVKELLFLSENCMVSEAASQLMELVHQTLQDVCVSSPRVALEFYRAARDALLLYEAIVPVKLERQLEGLNQAAVLMHNDCLYLSQEILGLAFEYRSHFPSSIKEHAIFVDMAPRFRLMAEEILQRQIQHVIFNLIEAIDGADGFQNTHQMKQYESAKFSMDQVVFILEKVHIIWEPLLMPSTYKNSMCMVLESVLSRMTKDILLLDDIAAEETIQLQRLINLILETLSSLLESLTADNQEGKSHESSTRTIDDLIPSLLKIRKLADILDMPLKSITTAWESGELIRYGFTLSEVVDLIQAIFTDSPLRKECLRRIHSASS